MRYRQTITRSRIYGEDSPTTAWMRQQAEISSFEIVVTDKDLKIHRHLNCVDGQGTRDIQCLMELEIKTRKSVPTWTQSDTYWLWHSTINRCGKLVKIKSQLVVNYGVSFWRLEKLTPEDSDWMEWGRFNEQGKIVWRRISLHEWFKLIRFEINPDTFTPQQFRRHHKTTKILVHERTPLGFEAQRYLINKS